MLRRNAKFRMSVYKKVVQCIEPTLPRANTSEGSAVIGAHLYVRKPIILQQLHLAGRMITLQLLYRDK